MMYFSVFILKDLIQYGVDNGLDRKKIEKEVLADLSALDSLKYISYERTLMAINYISSALKDDCLGLHIGEQMSLKATKYVDDIMNNSATLEEAFKNAVHYSKLISDALECQLKIKDGRYIVSFEPHPNWAILDQKLTQQITDLTLISSINSIVNYTGRKYYPLRLNLTCQRPKRINEYYRLFNCSISFNRERIEIIFAQSIFDQSNKTIKVGLLETLKHNVAHEIQQLNHSSPLIYKLKRVILNHKPKRIGIEQAAQSLNMSSRTLQRHLKEENTSFKMIEYEIQIGLAKTYLNKEGVGINEIAHLLGFSESSAFVRFFKNMIGITPLTYRKNKTQ